MLFKILSLLIVSVVIFLGSSLTTAQSPLQNKIIVFKDEVETEAVVADLAKKFNFQPNFTYSTAIKGFAVSLPAQVVEILARDPRIQFISEDKEVHTTSHRSSLSTQTVQTIPTGYLRVGASGASSFGTGVGVAVVDTGIDLDHPDLKDNIAGNYNCLRKTRSGDDDNGHGSHVAGTISAVNNSIGSLGVAPEAKLLAVKVLNSWGGGTWASVICGIDWSLNNKDNYNIKVLNLSLGGGGTSDNNCGNSNSDALHKAICRARDGGLTVVVAAGNDNTDASSFVPAAYDDAVITVSALADSDGQPGGLGAATSYGVDDTFATFSNFGTVVDIAAPGVSIYSTWKWGRYNTISGTSMATPHVAGAAAVYLKNNPGALWNQVRDSLVGAGEALGAGHSDPSGKHPEPVLKF